jgi:serine/threonine protein kinase
MTKCVDRGTLAYSFLEYVPGGSIGSRLRKHGKFSDNVTRSFTAQILEGLEYLHSKNIMHRVCRVVI